MLPNITLYESPEKILVGGLKRLLAGVAHDHPVAANARVGTTKLSNATAAKQVVVRGDGATPHTELQNARWENFGVNIYAASYQEADELARLVEGLIALLPLAREEVKKGEIGMSSVRLIEAEDTHQRYFTGTMLVLGSSTQINLNQ